MSPSNRKKHLASLERRRTRLEDRLAGAYIGDPEPTRRELSTVNWAIRVIEAAEETGMLDDLANMGYQV